MFVAVVIVWALILGISPGLALIAIPLLVLALDRYGGKGRGDQSGAAVDDGS